LSRDASTFYCIAPKALPHPDAPAEISSRIQEDFTMKESIAAAKRKAPLNSSASGGSGRSRTGKNEAAREFAQKGAAYAQETFEKAKATTEEGNKVLERTVATATKSAADFNLYILEMVHDNTNFAFDFARRLIAVTSPSEFFELSVAHARKQFESFTEQTQQLAALAQKVTAETVAPLQSGMMSTFHKVA
jgi:phasin